MKLNYKNIKNKIEILKVVLSLVWKLGMTCLVGE